MKFGMNLLLWSGELDESTPPVLESLKAMGYDGVEVPVFNLDLDYAAWGRRLDSLGLERTAEFWAIENGQAIGGAELTGTIDCGGAHQVTNRFQLVALGLLSGGQTVDNMLPQSHRTVGARQAQFGIGNTAGFLLRHVEFETIQIGFGGIPSNSAKVASQAVAMTRPERMSSGRSCEKATSE